MRGMNRHPIIALLSLIVLCAGCSSSVALMPPSPSAPPSAEAASTEIPAATQALPTTPTPLPSASPRPSRPASTVRRNAAAVSVVDGLRVRSKPRISDDSQMYEPLLPVGTQLYVLDGPVTASGYTWYEVVLLGSGRTPQGWVAAASRSGERWLAGGDFSCPPIPTDFRSLSALPPAVGLACFPRIPITVMARLISCNCDVDGAWLTPAWFSQGTGGPEMLVEPRMNRPPDKVDEWFWLHLDPAGQHAKVLPLGEVAKVTGIFDHPAAARCTFTEIDSEPVPSQRCRLAFAVTRLVTVGP
jgi:hypothetical protein